MTSKHFASFALTLTNPTSTPEHVFRVLMAMPSPRRIGNIGRRIVHEKAYVVTPHTTAAAGLLQGMELRMIGR